MGNRNRAQASDTSRFTYQLGPGRFEKGALRQAIRDRVEAIRRIRDIELQLESSYVFPYRLIDGLVDERNRDFLKAEISSFESDLRDADYRILDLLQRGYILRRLESEVAIFAKERTSDIRNYGFIMMKFPGNKSSEKGRMLNMIYDEVRDGLSAHGVVPIRADDFSVGEYLWDDVKVQIHGAGCGVAIFDNEHGEHLNPNVVREAAYMEALGRPVLFLVQRELIARMPADYQGTLTAMFDWSESEENLAAVRAAVERWLSRVVAHLYGIPGVDT